MNVITNTTVLSNFAAISQLDLLRQLYGAIYIPTEVYEEIRGGLEEGYRFYAGIDQLIHPFVEKGWIRLTGVTDEPNCDSWVNYPDVCIREKPRVWRLRNTVTGYCSPMT